MKKLLLLCALFCAALPLVAQKVYFIYIESEARSPFYLKMGEKVHSSSSSGYLILSRLIDSTYSFMVGPGTNMPEVRFEISLKGKDRGFLLKKLNEEWGLFDMQSLELVRPAGSGNGVGVGARVREDRFTSLLSQAAGDTSILYQPAVSVAAPAEKKKQEEKREQLKKTAVAPVTVTAKADEETTPVVTTGAVTDTVQNKELTQVATPADTTATQASVATTNNAVVDTASTVPTFKRSVVSRRSESSTVEGFGLMYTDEMDGAVDTIRLVIPNARVVFSETAPAEEKEAAPAKPARPVLACNGQAGEKDFFKLRRNLASIDAEAGMTAAALEVFRKRCFSVEQVKNLSSLFLTQSGKYAFLEAAYPYVYDRERFASLQSELFDPTYLARFKALTSN